LPWPSSKKDEKFHLMNSVYMKPGFVFFSHFQSGSALSPLTSILARIGNSAL